MLRRQAPASLHTSRDIEAIRAADLSHSKEIRIGSVVVAKEGEHVERYFVLPAGGGTVLREKTSESVVVVTPASPLGTALLGKAAGAQCEVRAPRGVRYLTILSVE